MLKHYIIIKYKPNTPQKHISSFIEQMYALKDSIPELKFLEIGQDQLKEERSWDLILNMQFASIEQLKSYQLHENHISVMQFNSPFVEDVAAIDFVI